MYKGKQRTAHAALGLALALSFPGLIPAEVSAQYFGRNKVQYESFDFRVLSTEHYRIHFYPEERAVVEDAARQAERWNARLSPIFQHRLSEIKPIIFYANHPDFQQTNVGGGGLIEEGTGGFTEGLRTRLVMPFAGSYKDNDHVLGHEMVHVYQYDVAQSRGGPGIQAMNQLPLWLIEGMAEYFSLGRDDPNTAMWLRDAALRGDLPTLSQLGRDPRYFPYRYGQALWAYIGGRWGDRAIIEVYRFALREGWEAALRRVLGVSSQQLSQDWIAAIRTAYLPAVEGRTRPGDAGDHVLGKNELGEWNLDPVISPDGKYVAFLSRRGLFSTDLYVADAHTGHIVKKLTSPSNTGHFDAVTFIYSAGSWSPDGKKFAFTVFAEGDQELAILNVDSRSIERQIRVKGVGEINNPSWSPDGKSLAFSGNAGGITDLYVMDLASEKVQQLTNDKYAELQPTWSPDGKMLAFATDRGPNTDFSTLTYSDMQLGMLELSSGQIKVLPLFDKGKHINPQFSPDGRSLFFISDRDGFSDIYRTDLASGKIFQVTRLATAVSGIAALSPAMSVSMQTGRMMFAVFQNSGYNVYGLDQEKTQGTPCDCDTGGRVANAGVLPPVEALQTSVVSQYLADATTGLPTQPSFAISDYKPSLHLDYLGQPSFGVGTSSFGTQIGGSASAYFGDLLGNHNLGVAIQANGQVKDIGGQVFYQNAKNRWNWAAVVGHIPYLAGYAGVGFDQIGNTPVQVVQQLRLRTYFDQALMLAQYPFSQTRRFEVSAGYNHIGYDYETRDFFYSLGGTFIGDSTTKFPKCTNESQLSFNTYTCTPTGIHLGMVSAAFVADNTFFGFTSPVTGTRYRLEVTPTYGTLTYASALADYRTYKFVSPFTLAFRGMHYGRYGRDASDYRQQPLFLGYPFWIRGYESGSFNSNECQGTGILRDPLTGGVADRGQNACPVFDRLIGSRIALASAEFRIPLLGTEQFGLINFPFFPTEIAPFVDVGAAWTSTQPVKFRFDTNPLNEDRVPVVSAGISARVNVLGYLVVEAYYVKPFQRPGVGAHFGFQIQPGW